MASLISATAWVARGVAQRHPTKYKLDEAELERVSKLARIDIEDARRELAKASKQVEQWDAEKTDGDLSDEDEAWEDEPLEVNVAADEADDTKMDVDEVPTDANDMSIYHLEDYDQESKSVAAGPFSNIKGLSYYPDNEDDPYITLKEDPEEDERQELEVLPTDNVLVVAKTEDEISQLEIYIYEETTESLYVHHDIMLPSFPLCLEWLEFPVASSSTSSSDTTVNRGNYIAVGTMDPEIEIWNLDTLDSLYPDALLGRPDKTAAHVPTPVGTGKKKKKKMKARTTSSDHHVDAVLSLSWNKTHRQLLASASADRTVKLWDLSRPSTDPAIRSLEVHKDKVQAVEWNQLEPTVILTGSYDRTVRIFDSRAPTAGVGAIVGADVEALRWDPWDANRFYVSLENGIVLNFDARTLPTDLSSPSPAQFTLSAHDGAVSALDVNPHIRGCLATGGTDKMIKVWNINEPEEGKREISLVTSRELGVGKVFSVTWSPDDPLTLAAAGSKAKLQLWEVGLNPGVRKTFSQKLKDAGREVKDKEGGGVIGVDSEGEESGEDE
ncbi:WD40 repeat-like protein [Dacryopinax primogenitus]|uniref:WD40 repeat-like protein n=1 Tax=Dacryopinax primogenitus (strain DJM 731) TaxID=1858805 RepID=M5G435_DACPD|nr:WD40 repeat-like protein [Dacryopinax primogenitus]EJU05026.1 WD40 repeat-like protein [Dacryopinax primogenitus]